MQKSLTDAVIEYQHSRTGLGPLLHRIALFVYNYPRTRLGWNADDCGEFFCLFYPRLRRLIERYQFHGRPFEVYLIVTLKWQLRTYAGLRASQKLRIRVLAKEDFWVSDNCAEYLPSDNQQIEASSEAEDVAVPDPIKKVLRINGRNRIEDVASRRRVLLLTLKCSGCMTESLIRRISALTGYDGEWIYCLVEELRFRMRSRRRRLACLGEKRNCSFFRIYCLQEQLRLTSEPLELRELTKALFEERARLARLLRKMSRVPLGPTHRDIAEVLDLPKGTVDSGLYYLKRALRKQQSAT